MIPVSASSSRARLCGSWRPDSVHPVLRPMPRIGLSANRSAYSRPNVEPIVVDPRSGSMPPSRRSRCLPKRADRSNGNSSLPHITTDTVGSVARWNPMRSTATSAPNPTVLNPRSIPVGRHATAEETPDDRDTKTEPARAGVSQKCGDRKATDHQGRRPLGALITPRPIPTRDRAIQTLVHKRRVPGVLVPVGESDESRCEIARAC